MHIICGVKREDSDVNMIPIYTYILILYNVGYDVLTSSSSLTYNIIAGFRKHKPKTEFNE